MDNLENVTVYPICTADTFPFIEGVVEGPSVDGDRCPFPEGSILSGIWHLNNLDVIISKMEMVWKGMKIVPQDTPFRIAGGWP